MTQDPGNLPDNPFESRRSSDEYRPNAGLAIFSGKGLSFVGRRAGSRGPYQWQMPQGGIDRGETPQEAAFRELEEETGLAPKHVELLEEMDDWLYYEFPPELKARLSGPYYGQKQKWFAFRLIGSESDFDLEKHHPEFDAWKWAPLSETPAMVIPFKRPVYNAVVDRFQKWTT